MIGTFTTLFPGWGYEHKTRRVWSEGSIHVDEDSDGFVDYMSTLMEGFLVSLALTATSGIEASLKGKRLPLAVGATLSVCST